MNFYPWKKLSEVEREILDVVVAGQIPDTDSIRLLQVLHDQCSGDPDAGETICFHGAKALLVQLKGDFTSALASREIEARKIRRAYECEQENPTDGWSLQNYAPSDLSKRDLLVEQLQSETPNKPIQPDGPSGRR